VAGGLAGVRYGFGAIPEQWIQALARHDEVEGLFNDFARLTESKA
jgi:ADP-ribosylglycohydrolase